MRLPHTFERIARAIAHARFSIVSVGIAYIVGLLFGALMVHAGSAFALRFRDRMVTDAQQTSPILASGHNVNLMVLDTEVYSNTGGQASKSTPRAAVAKFAAGGKPAPKKDLGLMAMSYGNVYVASVAMGAKDEHTLKAFLEAEAHDGPSLIIAYSHCIAHGINMTTAMSDQKIAVDSGQWLLYRYNPERVLAGDNPLLLDSRTPTRKVKEFMEQQARFKMLTKSKPEDAKRLWAQAQHDSELRFGLYEYLAQRKFEPQAAEPANPQRVENHKT